MTPIVCGSDGRGRRFCGFKQTVDMQPPPSPLELGQQIALTRDPQLGDREMKRRGGGRVADVVVAAATDDDLQPIGQRHAERLEIVAPHRTLDRPLRVAQLEVDPHAAERHAEHLAGQLHAREPAQLRA